MLGCLAVAGGCPDLGDRLADWSALDRPGPPDAAIPFDGGGEGDDAGSLDAATPAPGHADVLLQNITISPPYVRVAVGGDVTWYNLDPVQHDVRSGSPEMPAALFNSGLLDRGDSFSLRFEAAGIVRYYCSTHANRMRDAVVEVVEVAGDGR